MFKNYKTALSVIVVAAVLVASFSVISYVQTALAQGNTSGAAGGNATGNMTSSAGGATNATSGAAGNTTK